jgi:hypothetical protein
VAEQITDDAELRPIAEAFGRKYGTQTWDYVVRDGAFAHRPLGGRAVVFRVRPVRGLGFRKGRRVQPDDVAFRAVSVPGKLQRQVQAAIDEMVASGDEIGLQAAVTREGRMVAGAVAGTAYQRTGEPVTPGTLFFAASTGKGIASSVVHVLAERGELTYDQRVAAVWPEFGAHGKDVVTLADVLVHAAGVPGLWPEITPGDLCDAGRVCAFPVDVHGGRRGSDRHHALTFGFIVGEASAARPGRTLAEGVARPDHREPLGVLRRAAFGVCGGTSSHKWPARGRTAPRHHGQPRFTARPGHPAGRATDRCLREPQRRAYGRHSLSDHVRPFPPPASTRRCSVTSTV